MQMYEHGNDSIPARHPSLFKERFYTFTPIDDLVLLMPFETINNLKVGEWSRLDNNWLKSFHQHMGKADNNTIEQIQFLWQIYRLDWHCGSTEYKNADDQLLFLVHTANGNKCCINNTQLSEFIGDEDWINGEVNTLSNIASNRTISLSWGSKKKDTKNSECKVSPCIDATSLSVGDLVVVSNHGTKWTHHAKIVSINESTSSAVAKWNSNSKKDLVDLVDCMKYDQICVSKIKRKPTDFYQNLPVKIQRSDASQTPPPGQMKTCFTPRITCQNYVLRVRSET